MKISPSILAADLSDLRRVLLDMDVSIIDFIHLDVMDGHFVPALSFGERYCKQVSEASSIPLDVHLMVSQPELEVPKYFELTPHNITFHIEATNFPIRLSRLIREKNIKAGVSLNPGTPLEHIEPILDEIDLVLLMSVEPGFYGQSFIESSYRRVRQVRKMIGDRDIILEIDGGVNLKNIGALKEAGVDLAVAGSACFQGGDVNANVGALKKAAG